MPDFERGTPRETENDDPDEEPDDPDEEPGGAPLRVLVVDDNEVFRTGLVSLLADQPGIVVIGQASGGRAGIRLAEEARPDVVLIDLLMPGVGGLEATRVILRRNPSVGIVALTVASDAGAVTAALQAGASGFVTKPASVEDIVAAVRAAARGVAWLSRTAADALLADVRQAATESSKAVKPTSQPTVEPNKAVKLTSRERQVLALLAQGMENAEIADTLRISPWTAKKHVSSILAKLEVPNRIQAAIYAVRGGLV